MISWRFFLISIDFSGVGRCIGTLRGHDDEVLDVAFDFTGQMLLTASADGTARCYNAVSHNLISKFEGHEGEISKVNKMAQFIIATFILSSPELKAQVSFSDRLFCLSYWLYTFHIFIFSETTGPISTKVGAKYPSVKKIQVCSNERPCPFPKMI